MQGEQRQDDAEQANLVRDRERPPGELPAAQREQLRVDVLRQLVGDLRGHRAQGEAHELGGVGDVEDRVAALADEEDAVGLDRRLAEDRLERSRLDHDVDHRFEQRPRRHQVGRPAVDQVHHDLAPDDLAHAVVVEGGHGAVGKSVLVEDLGAEVVGDASGEQQRRPQDHEHHAGHPSRPAGGAVAVHAGFGVG